eukprot:scaffold104802_cov31-Tisochrysis_lutea.AAC.4
MGLTLIRHEELPLSREIPPLRVHFLTCAREPCSYVPLQQAWRWSRRHSACSCAQASADSAADRRAAVALPGASRHPCPPSWSVLAWVASPLRDRVCFVLVGGGRSASSALLATATCRLIEPVCTRLATLPARTISSSGSTSISTSSVSATAPAASAEVAVATRTLPSANDTPSSFSPSSPRAASRRLFCRSGAGCTRGAVSRSTAVAPSSVSRNVSRLARAPP